MNQLHDLSALELASALRGGEVSAQEVLDHTLERAHAIGPRVGAFVHIAEELARAQARDADERLTAYRRGHGEEDEDELPPLLGVPVPIKDLTQVAGLPFEAGSAAFAGNVAPVDDGVVTLLREAGTVMVGKTTTPEFGMPAYTEPDVAPPARTPWDLGRSAGGSSGGAGAAVAARIVPLAHASDGGGSIRIPAAACGLVGLKPSRSLVSPGPYGIEGPGLATHGVLSRTVRDTAVALDVLARPWPGDAPHPLRPDAGYLGICGNGVRRRRIGVLRAPVVLDDAPVHPQALAAVDRAVALLEAMGHEIVEAPHPFTEGEWDVFMPVWAMGALSVPVPPEREGELVALTRWLRDTGRGVSGLELSGALAGLERLRRQVAQRWEKLDLVLSPMLAGPPAPIGGLRDDADPAADFRAQRAYTPWGSLWNITGNPAISLPLHRAVVGAGAGARELPFGVLIGARHGQDNVLLALAAELEAADPWPFAPTLAPDLPSDLPSDLASDGE